MLNGARVCYEHQKEGTLVGNAARVGFRCHRISDANVTMKESLVTNVTGNNRFAYRSYDTYLTGVKQQGDQRYMARYHAHADQMMAEKCDGFINSNLSLDRRGPAAGATINPLRSLGCGLT